MAIALDELVRRYEDLNKRAIRVYERAGFTALRTFDHETNGGVHRFLEMARPA